MNGPEIPGILILGNLDSGNFFRKCWM